MQLSRKVAFRLLVGSVIVTLVAAAVALFAVVPLLWILVLVGIAGFWFALFQLIADAGRRASAVLLEAAARSAAPGGRGGQAPRGEAAIELGELKPLD